MKSLLFPLLAAPAMFTSAVALAEYQPKAEAVAKDVYAIVGPLGQRSAENDG
jgi:hypothetical protein